MPTVTGFDFANEALKWVDVPFRHQGRNRLGVDCIGLVVCTASAVGLYDISKDIPNYPREPSETKLQEGLLNHCNRIQPNSRQIGDILLFRDRIGIYGCHVAIVTSYGIVHALSAINKVAETPLDQNLLKLLKGVFRPKGISE